MSLGRVDDSELVQRARRGEAEAWVCLRKRYTPDAHRFASEILGSSDGVVAAVRESFVLAAEKIAEPTASSAFRAWLLRIVEHVADASLVSRARRGEAVAWERLVKRHWKAMYAIAWGLLGDREDARDVAQETFLRLYGHLQRLQAATSLRSWLGRTAYRCAIDLRRKRRREYALPLEHGTNHAEDTHLPDRRTQVDPVAECVRKELRRRALDVLPPKLSEVVLLRHYGGMKYREIADALGVSTGTVSTWLYEAYRLLRTHLQEDDAALPSASARGS